MLSSVFIAPRKRYRICSAVFCYINLYIFSIEIALLNYDRCSSVRVKIGIARTLIGIVVIIRYRDNRRRLIYTKRIVVITYITRTVCKFHNKNHIVVIAGYRNGTSELCNKICIHCAIWDGPLRIRVICNLPCIINGYLF